MQVQRNYRCLDDQAISAGKYALRVVQEADVELIRQWRNDQLDVLRQSAPISREQQKAYFQENIWPSMKKDRPCNILMTLLEEGKPIGYGGLVHIAWEHRRAEVSFLLDAIYAPDPQAYSRHFSNYLAMIKTLGFSVLNFNRLYAETYAFRHQHIQILESSGFRLEGRMRQHVIIDGNRVDSLIHGALNEK